MFGRNCRFLQGEDSDSSAVTQIRNVIAEARECTVTLKNYRKDGAAFWNELTVSTVKDSNGNILQNGDTVTLIKDLDVKGASFTAKRGTAVRRISLVMDNPEHIQGRIKDQTIIILTKFVKK